MLDLQRREQVLASAVAAGKFPESRREHYARMWDADPERTEALIDATVGVPAALLSASRPTPARNVAAAEAETVTAWTRQLFPETRVPVVMDGDVVGYGYDRPPGPAPPAPSPPPETSPAPPAASAAATFAPGDVKVWSKQLFPDAPGNALEGKALPLIVDCND
jgi:hypothetical protein